MRRAIALLATAAAATLALAAPAQAFESPYPGVRHLFDFGSAGSGAGELFNPAGIAVNDTSGDVYVADSNNNRIAQFDADGNFIRAWGQDVVASGPDDRGPGVFEVCDAAVNPADVCKRGEGGSAAGSFNTATGVAVDNSGGPADGSVYVVDSTNLRVQRFTAEGQFVLTWGNGVNATTGGDVCTAASGDSCKAGLSSTEPSGFSFWGGSKIAVDGAGRVIAITGENLPTGDTLEDARAVRFDAGGAVLDWLALSPALAFTAPTTIAADAAGNVYIYTGAGNGGLEGAFRLEAADFVTGLSGGLELTYDARDQFSNNSALAIDPETQFLLLVERGPFVDAPCQVTAEESDKLIEYHPGGQVVDCSTVQTAGMEDLGAPFTTIKSLDVSVAHRLYATVLDEVRVFAMPVPEPPALGIQSVEPLSHSALVGVPVTANLADTDASVQFGTAGPCSANPCAQTDPQGAGASRVPEEQTLQVSGLQPDTTYHYRVAATNSEGTTYGPDRVFRTFPEPVFDPSCENNLARQQTGAAFTDDCRAYELVSAPDAGGYDVESSIVSGQEPYGGYPEAKDRALYAIHNGVIPGVEGNPTNRGPDPYVATRDEANQRWNTTYAGLPADAPEGPLTSDPFSSSLLGTDAGLESLAFGGPDICDPCFADGSAGIPLRMPDGSLIQGMAGPIAVADPTPSGEVRVPLSADGTHFLFASKQAFVPGANDNGADVTIYDRNLKTGLTQIASTNPSSGVLANGEDVVALDVSDDGSRILVGNRVGTDAAGNSLFDLYTHEGTSPFSVEVADTPSGVLYAGMSADGRQVLFSTPDRLADDTDDSADLFRATIDAGAATVERVSFDPAAAAGGTGDRDGCDPAQNSSSKNWNAPLGAPADCSAVAIGGGGGVASESGAVYFLSPEDLDGKGTPEAPNLYLARPGQAPRFVAELESELSGAPPLSSLYRFGGNLGSFNLPLGVAVDRAGGYLYVFDLVGGAGNSKVKKFDLSGDPVDFTAGSGAGTNALNGSDAPTGAFSPFPLSPAALAFDEANGKLYVPDYLHNVVDVFNADGSYDSQLAVTTPSAVSIHPLSGDVYVSSRTTNRVFLFPSGGGSSSFSVISTPNGVAVDSAGTVYVVDGRQTAQYDAGGTFVRVLDPNASFGVAVDPDTDDVFVNERSRIAQFDSTGNPTGGSDGAGAPISDPAFGGSAALALGPGGDLYASNANSRVAHFLHLLAPDASVDSPLVQNALAAPETRRLEDFQTTPSGAHAAFPTSLDLAGSGFDSAKHTEVYRYEDSTGELACASCSPTLLAPSSDASLPTNGLGIAPDGRVFFNTQEALVLRDVNERVDAYQWDGEPRLISNGLGNADQALLTISADGTDALFFTRETLVEEDLNGNHVKLYDAREGGGFFKVPEPPPCVASDECHGAGSEAPPRPPISTTSGTDGNVSSQPQPGCGRARAVALAAKSRAASKRAEALRRSASKAPNRRAARRLRARARRLARAARRNAAAAKRCRASLRGAQR